MNSIYKLLENLNIKTLDALNQYLSELPDDKDLQDKERQYQEWLDKFNDHDYMFNHGDEFDINEMPEAVEFRVISNENIKNFDFGFEEQEARIYTLNQVLHLEYRIIDLELLNLKDLKEIKFENCVFLGDVSITDKNPISKIYIDNCIFLKNLSIKNIINSKDMSLIIYRSNINNLVVQESVIKEIRISSSKIFLWCFFACGADSLFVNDNHIEILEASDNLINGGKYFDSRQVNIDNIGFRIKNSLFSSHKLKSIEEIECKINLFESKKSKYINNPEERNRMIEKNITIKTIEFLEDFSDLKEQKKEYFTGLLKKRVFNQDSKVLEIIVKLTGGFVKPLYFLRIAFIIYIFFALIYMIPFFEFDRGPDYYTVTDNNMVTEVQAVNTPKSLNLLDALYFSGITFTTIGYGDICPLGAAKVLVVFEGILGVTVTSAFLIAFINRYID